MKRLFTLLLLIAPCANATYVASGKADFAVAATTNCVPNGAGVTTGHELVMLVQANSVTAITVTGLNSTWGAADQTQTQAAGTVTTYSFHAVATGTGAETITATFTSGTALIGSICFDFSTTAFDSSNSTNGTGGLTTSVTTTHAIADLVGFVTAGVGDSATIVAPFTPRQTISFSGQVFGAAGDQHVTSTGTYAFSPAGVGTGTVHLLALYGTATATSKQAQSQIVRNGDVQEKDVWVCNPTVDFICERKRTEHNSKRHGN